MLANHPMLRRTLGFVLLAMVACLTLKIVFAVFGTVIALAVTVLSLAAAGYVVYLVLRVLSPTTAAKVREAIRGHPPLPPEARS